MITDNFIEFRVAVDFGNGMWTLANHVVSRFGIHETGILILAALIVFVYLIHTYLQRPVACGLKVGAWLPLVLAACSAVTGIHDAGQKYSLLHSQGAINKAQEQLLFQQAHRGAIRVLTIGGLCSIGLLCLLRLQRPRRPETSSVCNDQPRPSTAKRRTEG